MQRCRLAIALALSLLLAPLAAEAQQVGKVYRIGFLSSLPVPATAMSDSLRNAGFVEGQNVVIDRRLTEAPEQLPALAEDLVRHQPDVVVAYWNRDVVAAQAATRSIPIVMVVGVDPPA
jgi:putative ABC transport system substrate-binding protein